MKYLLDSHILIWSLFFDEKLSNETLDIINNPANSIYYSAASVWEIEIKHEKKPEKMPVSGELLVDCCEQANMISLPITKEHAIAVHSLHRAENAPPHKDPFDMLLVAQAKTEKMLLLTHASLLGYYDEPYVKTV